MSAAAQHHGPLDQFAIQRYVDIELGGMDISFTNSAMMMVLAVVVITMLMTMSVRTRRLVPTRMQSVVESLYELVARMLGDNVGPEGRKYFPFIFSLFMFVLFCNALGLLPFGVVGLHSFTPTSHIIVTFALASVVFIGVTIIGLIKHKLHFFSLFMPTGVPMYMAPLLVPIEIVSYLARPVTLSLRLFANMMAGHTMLAVFGSFVALLGIFGFAPFLVIVALMALEVVVALLQAYVFTILTCLYLNDALHLH